jgi:predicted AAA+ superfamily ATPase
MYARCLTERLRRLLGVMPAVYLQGARQTGKTTLAKQLLEAGVLRDYVSFDDPLVRTAAQRDPVSFVRNLPTGTALDEAQLVPEVMPVLKMRIDESRAAGMFLLTGSASPLANAQVADAMVGRMVALQLLPLAQAEMADSAVNWGCASVRGTAHQRTLSRRGGLDGATHARGATPSRLRSTTQLPAPSGCAATPTR